MLLPKEASVWPSPRPMTGTQALSLSRHLSAPDPDLPPSAASALLPSHHLPMPAACLQMRPAAVPRLQLPGPSPVHKPRAHGPAAFQAAHAQLAPVHSHAHFGTAPKRTPGSNYRPLTQALHSKGPQSRSPPLQSHAARNQQQHHHPMTSQLQHPMTDPQHRPITKLQQGVPLQQHQQLPTFPQNISLAKLPPSQPGSRQACPGPAAVPGKQAVTQSQPDHASMPGKQAAAGAGPRQTSPDRIPSWTPPRQDGRGPAGAVHGPQNSLAEQQAGQQAGTASHHASMQV